MPAFGVYPVADARGIGELSSTYEGRHVTLVEDEITHPPGGDGLVDQYDPCVIGAQGVGVAMTSAVADSDLIALDTEGIWILDVHAEDDGGAGSAVAGGDLIYINTTSCVLSKITNGTTQIPFGIALGVITTPGNTERIAVKVHYDPSLQNDQRKWFTVTDGAYNYGFHTTGLLEEGQSTGVAGYFDAQVDGVQDGGIYAFGAWMEPQADFVANGSLLVVCDAGIYQAAGDMSGARMVMQQYICDLSENPTSLHIFRINVAAAAGAIDALFVAANPDSLAYSAGTAGTGGVVGTIPLADIVGVGIVYIDVYGAIV